MAAHRFADLLPDLAVATPQASAGGSGFMACPAVLLPCALPTQAFWQQQLYQRAYAEAQAVVRPSVVVRLQACLEN